MGGAGGVILCLRFFKPMEQLRKLSRLYLKTVEMICICLLMAILGCMLIQILCRLLVISQSFTEELARICFCILVFVGSPLALAEGLHIVVDMLVRKAGPAMKKAILVLDGAAIDIFSVFCIIGMITMMKSSKLTTAVALTWIKMNWIYALILISFFFLFIVSTVQIVLAIQGKETTVDLNAEEKKAVNEAANKELEESLRKQLGGGK